MFMNPAITFLVIWSVLTVGWSVYAYIVKLQKQIIRLQHTIENLETLNRSRQELISFATSTAKLIRDRYQSDEE